MKNISIKQLFVAAALTFYSNSNVSLLDNPPKQFDGQIALAAMPFVQSAVTNLSVVDFPLLRESVTSTWHNASQYLVNAPLPLKVLDTSEVYAGSQTLQSLPRDILDVTQRDAGAPLIILTASEVKTYLSTNTMGQNLMLANLPVALKEKARKLIYSTKDSNSLDATLHGVNAFTGFVCISPDEQSRLSLVVIPELSRLDVVKVLSEISSIYLPEKIANELSNDRELTKAIWTLIYLHEAGHNANTPKKICSNNVELVKKHARKMGASERGADNYAYQTALKYPEHLGGLETALKATGFLASARAFGFLVDGTGLVRSQRHLVAGTCSARSMNCGMEGIRDSDILSEHSKVLAILAESMAKDGYIKDELIREVALDGIFEDFFPDKKIFLMLKSAARSAHESFGDITFTDDQVKLFTSSEAPFDPNAPASPFFRHALDAAGVKDPKSPQAMNVYASLFFLHSEGELNGDYSRNIHQLLKDEIKHKYNITSKEIIELIPIRQRDLAAAFVKTIYPSRASAFELCSHYDPFLRLAYKTLIKLRNSKALPDSPAVLGWLENLTAGVGFFISDPELMNEFTSRPMSASLSFGSITPPDSERGEPSGHVRSAKDGLRGRGHSGLAARRSHGSLSR